MDTTRFIFTLLVNLFVVEMLKSNADFSCISASPGFFVNNHTLCTAIWKIFALKMLGWGLGVKRLSMQSLMYTLEKRILPLILVCYEALLVKSTNTYNNIDCNHMFNEVRAGEPALLACIESCYSFQPHLLFGDCVVLSIDVAFISLWKGSKKKCTK